MYKEEGCSPPLNAMELWHNISTASWSPISVGAVEPRRAAAMLSGTIWYLMGEDCSWEKRAVSRKRQVWKRVQQGECAAEFNEKNRTSRTVSGAESWQWLANSKCTTVEWQVRSWKPTAALIMPRGDCWGSGSFVKMRGNLLFGRHSWT